MKSTGQDGQELLTGLLLELAAHAASRRLTRGEGGAEMLHIREAIVVEGRYDKNALSQVVDTLILETGGFRHLQGPGADGPAAPGWPSGRGLIVLTDSDGAGFVIRSRIKGAVPRGSV